MKNLLTVFVLAMSTQVALAQFDLEKVRAGGTFGYAAPLGEFSDYAKGGITYQLDLSYDLNPKLAVGVEYGTALTAAYDEGGSGLLGLNLYGLETYLLKSWYTFSEKKIRPFVAAGVGVARFSEPDYTFNETTVQGSRRTGLGMQGEFGVKLGDFHISYAFVMNGKSATEPVYNDQIGDLSIRYHRFGLGYLYDF